MEGAFIFALEHPFVVVHVVQLESKQLKCIRILEM